MLPIHPYSRQKEQAEPIHLTVLGCSGSIGQNTADIVRQSNGRLVVDGLTAYDNVEELIRQARELRPALAVIGKEEHYSRLKEGLEGTGIRVAAGSEAILEAASLPSPVVMSAIVGAAGLLPTLTAIRRGARIALANKECLVCAGKLMMLEIKKHHASLIPVDSEHNAIFQVFDFEQPEKINRIIVTASGGPFREWTKEQMAEVTPEQAVRHPNWSMGAKISVDSATMMNKGLEVIEAFHLFPVKEEQIEVLVHPESIIHSMVEYADGSVLAQMSPPDMRTPIAYALCWPERMQVETPRLNLAEIGRLSFFAPDMERFPALRLAREALKTGGAGTTVLNAANEVAVASFLNHEIGFLDIIQVVETTLETVGSASVTSIEEVMLADREARICARERCRRIAAGRG
jgi:1-deoxy-D-xylulose-5-phosphate reductoisomerase